MIIGNRYLYAEIGHRTSRSSGSQDRNAARLRTPFSCMGAENSKRRDSAQSVATCRFQGTLRLMARSLIASDNRKIQG
ncbi:hypothetical protein [Achromobacter sp. 413638]|uniref:hypothetical protein n=1 Tax=Achromobacter sp. 413638 TaxID=3342385 RepID=UPI00370C8FD2